MEIYSVFDTEFLPYGTVHKEVDTTQLCRELAKQEKPSDHTVYVPSCPDLEQCDIMACVQEHLYGGMPVQIGFCNGTNTKLNCLEYHRDSEINIPESSTIFLLAHQWQMRDGVLDTENVKAFQAPGGTVVEFYATTLHYAPCDGKLGEGFRVAVVLPRGTNESCPKNGEALYPEDRYLWAKNKWLLAHADSDEAKQGAWVGLKGKNIDLHELLQEKGR